MGYFKTQMYTRRPLVNNNLNLASQLDKKWFGDNGVSVEDLKILLQKHPNENLGIFDNSKLIGFAMFEILENNQPRDYVGRIIAKGKVMFIHQFTTETNYNINGWEADIVLLKELEKKALELNCHEVWEALSINHPYSKAINNQYDAYGFYKNAGYIMDNKHSLVWSPSNNSISIPCILFRKELLPTNKNITNIISLLCSQLQKPEKRKI